MCFQMQSANSVEFDSAVFESLGFSNIDLSAFNGSNDQFSGEYIATVSVNGECNPPFFNTI